MATKRRADFSTVDQARRAKFYTRRDVGAKPQSLVSVPNIFLFMYIISMFFCIFLCLKFYVSTPLFPFDPSHVVSFLLSDSGFYFLDPRVSRPFLSFSSGWASLQKMLRYIPLSIRELNPKSLHNIYHV